MNVKTVYGTLRGCTSPEYYENGQVKSCRFQEENNILTDIGLLVPQYTEEDVRRKYNKSISFYKSGAVKSISLEQQTEIMTPIGEFPAELVTFYEGGSLRRVFPLNGKLSGYWSEQNETDLSFPMNFEFDFGAFSAKIMCVHFYETGEIRSITLFPGEVITLDTPIGSIEVKTGFSLFLSGALQSAEPAVPVTVSTPVGKLNAFDISAIGIHGDTNSLVFDEAGSVVSLTTSSEAVIVQEKEKPLETIEPVLKPNPLDEKELILVPVKVSFSEDTVTFSEEETHTYRLSDTKFTVVKSYQAGGCSPSDCASCSGCSLKK